MSTIRLIADPIPGVSVEFSAKSCGRGITLPNGVCSNLEVGNEVSLLLCTIYTYVCTCMYVYACDF